jgi:hypothetical protein
LAAVAAGLHHLALALQGGQVVADVATVVLPAGQAQQAKAMQVALPL